MVSTLIPLSDADLREMRGVKKIVAWYGRWPSFHDSYLLDAHFSAWERSYVRVLLFRSFDEGTQGCAIVTVHFGRLIANELMGCQGQLLGVTFYKFDDSYRVVIEGDLTVSATIDTDELSFDLCVWPPHGPQ